MSLLFSLLFAFTAQAKISSVYFNSNGIPMHALLAGDANLPPVLLIHGSPGHASQWLEQLKDPRLTKKFQLIAIDRPGYGQSDTGYAQPDLSVQVKVAAAALSFNKSNLPIRVVGYSYGGAIAALLALDHTKKINSLILLAPAIDPDYELPRWYEDLGDNPLWLWALPTDWQVYLAETMPFSEQLSRMSPQLSQIRVPVEYIQGEADTTVSTLTVNFVRQKFTHARLHVEMIPGMTHAILVERPDLVTRVLLADKSEINRR